MKIQPLDPDPEAAASTPEALAGVLLVEDEPLLRRLLAQFLRSRGFEVEAAASLGEARALLCRRRFDTAVVDVGLPDGDGLDLLAHLGADRAIAISASPDGARYLRAGVRHRLEKPLDLDTLTAEIRRLVEVGRERASAGKARGIILAAGGGSRLGRHGRGRPKCLLEVGGRTLLDHQMGMLADAGIRDVCVVAGYEADQIRRAADGRACVIENPIWDETNSLYSASLCADFEHETLIVLNGDLLVHPEALRRVLASEGSAFAFDSSSGRDREHMKVDLRGGFLAAMSKDLPRERVHGENIGLLRFEPPTGRALFREIDRLLAGGEEGSWMARAVESVARRVPVRGVDVADLPWIEIDFPEDLERAKCDVWPRLRALSEGAPTEPRSEGSRAESAAGAPAS